MASSLDSQPQAHYSGLFVVLSKVGPYMTLLPNLQLLRRPGHANCRICDDLEKFFY